MYSLPPAVEEKFILQHSFYLSGFHVTVIGFCPSMGDLSTQCGFIDGFDSLLWSLEASIFLSLDCLPFMLLSFIGANEHFFSPVGHPK